MGWFSHIGNVLKNEVSHTGNLLGGIIHSPAKSIGQFAIGAGDPLSSKMWNSVLGTHFKPLVGQLGGETQAQFDQSARQGVNVKDGEFMGKVANTVAGSIAGSELGISGGLVTKLGAAGDAVGGNGPSSGTTLGGGSMATGTGSMGGSGTDWSSVIGGLGSLYNGMTANSQANGLQGILNNAYSFNASRPMYANELNQLMANPEQAVTSSPGYQAQMDQALQASQRTAASQGLTGSGTEAAALAQTGANLEQSTYNNLFSQLSMLSGATLDPAKMFSEQMSVDQTKQNASTSMLGSLGSMFGSGGGGGGLGSWFSNLFSSGGGTGGGSGLTSMAGSDGSYLSSLSDMWSSYDGG